MNGIYFCKLFLESTFTFTNWNLNLQLTDIYKVVYMNARYIKMNWRNQYGASCI